MGKPILGGATKTKIKCPYSEDCCDIDSEKCASCLNNKKRSYYKPDEPDANCSTYIWDTETQYSLTDSHYVCAD